MKNLLLLFFLSIPLFLTAQFSSEKFISRDLGYVRGLESNDLDGDGSLDIIVAGSGGVVYYLNDGNGNFDKEDMIHITGDYTPSMATTDIDLDGHIDVVVGDAFEGNLSWYKNNGNGEFIQRFIIDNNLTTISDMAVGTLNTDNRADIIVSQASNEQFLIFKSTGSTAFSAPTSLSTTGNAFSKLEIGDIDGDGDLDFASISYSQLTWFSNNGIGNFTTTPIVDHTTSFYDVLLSDFDANGTMDIVTATSPEFQVHSNDGNENFTLTSYGGSSSINGIRDLAVDDFNMDGNMDVFFTTTASDETGWFAANGTGGFFNPSIIEDDLATSHSIILADFNTDGITDIAYGYFDGLSLAKGLSSGVMGFPQNILEVAGQYAQAVASLDVDNDGDMDVIAGFYSNSSSSITEVKLSWYENINDQFRRTHHISTASDGLDEMRLGDIDNDGDQDLLTTSRSGDYFSWYENNNDGTFESEVIVYTNVSGRMAIADLNGDNNLDVILVSGSTNVFWLTGDGTGNFSASATIGTFTLPNHIHPVDIDMDGDQDLLISDYSADQGLLLLNDGNGNFSTPQVIINNVNTIRDIKTGDFDGDNDLDIVVCLSSEDELRWYTNDGNENFTYSQLISTRDFPYASEVADMDNDGDLDIVTNYYSDYLSWFINDGNGNFILGSSISQDDGSTSSMSLADINGDGGLDILAGYVFFDDQMVVWHESPFLQTSIQGNASNISCNNNMTAYDASDDFIAFNLLLTESGLGSSNFQLTVSNGTISPASGIYGQSMPYTLNPGSPGMGDVIVTATDISNPSYSVQITIIDPGSCALTPTIEGTANNISCNNNMTEYDASDDFIIFDLLLTESGLGSDFQLTVDNGTISPASGIYDQTSSFSLNLGSAGTGDVIVTATDISNPSYSVQITITNPGSCALTPTISGTASNISCNNNTTEYDVSDDFIAFDLLVTENGLGSDFQLTVDNGTINPAYGTYDQSNSFTLNPGSAGSGSIIVTATDISNPSYSVQITITDPGSCGLDSTINGTASNISCNSNMTDYDASDDFITFDLLFTENGLGPDFQLTVDNGTISPSSGTYDQTSSFALNTGSASSGDVIITATDISNPSYSVQITVTDPGSCALDPTISGTASNVTCNDNSTTDITSDDFIEFDLLVSAGGLSDGFSIEIDNGVISPNTGNYDASNSYSLQLGSAGAGDTNITITDNEDVSYFVEFPVMDPGNCSLNTSISSYDFIDFSVSPNPSNGQVNFELDGSHSPCKIEIRNVLGILIFEGTIHHAPLIFNGENLPKGNYFFSVFNEESVRIKNGILIFSY